MREVFSDAQKEAVTWGQGPLLVIAGPGSGKTFVITHRVRYLTETLVKPSSGDLPLYLYCHSMGYYLSI